MHCLMKPSSPFDTAQHVMPSFFREEGFHIVAIDDWDYVHMIVFRNS